MNTGLGWIKLHRQILSDPLYLNGEFSFGQAWIDLNLLANHEEKEFMTDRGILVKCGRGEVAWSQKNLAKRWGWSENKVRRYIRMLKAIGRVNAQTNNATTVISITCYNEEQKVNAQVNAQTNAQVNDKQEYKEKKKYLVV